MARTPTSSNSCGPACGGGADYAFEAAGLPALATIAFDAIRPGGMVVLVGVPADGELVSFPGNVLVRSEKIVTGTFYGSARPALDMPLIMRLYAEGKFPLDRSSPSATRSAG